VVDVTLLLRRHRNPPRHERMKTAKIVHVARMFQRNVAYSLCRYRNIPILVSRRCGVRDKVAGYVNIVAQSVFARVRVRLRDPKAGSFRYRP